MTPAQAQSKTPYTPAPTARPDSAPVELSPEMFKLVSGGLPKGGWTPIEETLTSIPRSDLG